MKCFFCNEREATTGSVDLIISGLQRDNGICDSNDCQDRYDAYWVSTKHPLFFLDELSETEWQIVLRSILSANPNRMRVN